MWWWVGRDARASSGRVEGAMFHKLFQGLSSQPTSSHEACLWMCMPQQPLRIASNKPSGGAYGDLGYSRSSCMAADSAPMQLFKLIQEPILPDCWDIYVAYGAAAVRRRRGLWVLWRCWAMWSVDKR